VPCEQGAVACNGPEVCCYSDTDFGCDTCSTAGVCPSTCDLGGGGFYQLQCNESADCPSGDECCGTFSTPDQQIFGTHCALACSSNENVFCSDDTQCAGLKCKALAFYPGYKTCR
jgi:hypothetical protein